ncbi:DUF4097 family beta strand repeat protein [Streptomyces sp. SID5785]|uniref:DUF4097 family beta strand repeat-containing protein n=1 Tax=Streptomyces sp. SID5785 TaxID=2690309 RepID=UPI001361AAF0|nr:DUF4097 family beta strand repeat-containing protein [Streptomyces sp. SID5785]MZD05074.1 DUF4097 family beta strand repeat protein [Streptomyces sp. SID5785]
MTARPRRTVRVLAATAATAALAVTVTACGADADDDAHPDHRSFALQGRTLTVDTDDSALELVPGDSDRVQVTRWFRGSTVIGSDPKVTWRWDADTDRLTLRLHCSGFVADCAARHRVEVPRGIAVVVRGDDGSVRAEGLRNGLDVSARDGSVRVTNTAGPLRLHTEDGSVKATGVDARRVSVHTEDGSADLALRTVPDRVDAVGEDGSVTLALPGSARYKVATHSEDGSVHVAVPRADDSAHRVSVRTQDGKVTLRTAN